MLAIPRSSRRCAAVLACALSATLVESAQAGEFDPAFGSGGSVVISCTTSVTQAVAQADGGMLVIATPGSGAPSYLTRLGPTGQVDATFAGDGQLELAGGADAESPLEVAERTDGRIVVVGRTGQGIFVRRFTAGGEPDTSFGANGVRALDPAFRFYDGARPVLQPDGGIVVAVVTGQGPVQGALVRLTPTGGIDEHFGSGGRVDDPAAGDPEGIMDVRADAAGRLYTLDYAAAPTSAFVVSRFSAAGAPDADYGDAGSRVVAAPFRGGQGAGRLLVTPAGKAVVVAQSPPSSSTRGNLSFTRLSGAGDFDPTFAGDGQSDSSDFGWSLGENPIPRGVGLRPDGGLLVGTSSSAGVKYGGPSYVLHLRADGLADKAAPGAGVQPLPGGVSYLKTLSVGTDGGYVTLANEYSCGSVLRRFFPDASTSGYGSTAPRSSAVLPPSSSNAAKAVARSLASCGSHALRAQVRVPRGARLRALLVSRTDGRPLATGAAQRSASGMADLRLHLTRAGVRVRRATSATPATLRITVSGPGRGTATARRSVSLENCRSSHRPLG